MEFEVFLHPKMGFHNFISRQIPLSNKRENTRTKAFGQFSKSKQIQQSHDVMKLLGNYFIIRLV